ncbi:hypothetical protein RF679_11790 [Undibacterium cyanobacteriorum]|uniref:Uncharacterized protein n=1 Tax=Undibacterium cyanobacteriorum TaxID=3073561 RepID=A0ABY9RF89_9BURK|nr:hypothetical protein [Undibacterium sp. 20NA77.5]WMW79324.1 hypothetical protein RF679_11765 [Undibacterium sp. 20NA77.5]WMW79329.1 hypothetical protein RF679_11790 [Undibacterium sp. 20NA77.5]
MTGVRESMAHDPVSFIFRGSSPLKATIRVPRITGQVDAAEIFPASGGGYRHFGKINFSGLHMVVDIHYDNTDAKRIAPFTFNGEYVLRAVQGSQ